MNHAHALVSACPQYVSRHPRTLSNTTAAAGLPSLISLMVSVDVKQHPISQSISRREAPRFRLPTAQHPLLLKSVLDEQITRQNINFCCCCESSASRFLNDAASSKQQPDFVLKQSVFFLTEGLTQLTWLCKGKDHPESITVLTVASLVGSALAAITTGEKERRRGKEKNSVRQELSCVRQVVLLNVLGCRLTY